MLEEALINMLATTPVAIVLFYAWTIDRRQCDAEREAYRREIEYYRKLTSKLIVLGIDTITGGTINARDYFSEDEITSHD